MQTPIYLDYMSTTPVDPQVAAKMRDCLEMEGCFGNPASQSHRYGWDAMELVQQARQQVADLINADPREIIWTSGATESDNLAIQGAALFYQRKGKHIITMSTEHKAVLDTCHYLSTQGFEVTYLNPDRQGLLAIEQLEQALRPDTILVSIMHVNNETGVIHDIAKIGECLKGRGIIFHVDAAQSAGKLPIDLQQLSVDLMSFSAHKIYGPKGVGALYVRRQPRVRLVPMIHGGGHEWGMRSGTLPTHQIVGMGEAFAIAKAKLAEDPARISRLRDHLWEGISQLSGITLNGDQQHRSPGCLNITIEGIDNETLLLSLNQLAISTGSACNSANPTPSHVLTAMGLTRQQANSSIRLSVGRFTTLADIDTAIAQMTKQIIHLREQPPTWETAARGAIKKSPPEQ